MRTFRGIDKATLLILSTAVAVSACAPLQFRNRYDAASNGIYVGEPKVYNDRALQQMLSALRNRLATISAIDQGSLVSKYGTMQGARLTQTQIALQATASPTPGTVTTANAGTPSITQGTGSSATTGTSPGQTTSQTTTTTTPSNTSQVVTTVPAATPAAPALPSAPTSTLPTAFSVSASDTLNEQMQLSYEIINLQLLLQGALNDEYSSNTGEGKRRVTVGFPIAISTPADRWYEYALAEVEISVCSPVSTDLSTPSLMTILPREKTYNTAAITSSTASIGAGAVIGNILNVGGSFLRGRQTYYIVQAQDTVALQRSASTLCPTLGKSSDDGSVPATAKPLVFAWQFRPVLGQATVHQGMRQTFAQLSLAPGEKPFKVMVRTSWREYDPKSGVAGRPVGREDTQTFDVKTFYNTVNSGIQDFADNGDGTSSIKVEGHFLAGTQVRLGDTYIADVGVENTGTYLRFTVPNQLIATKNVTLVSPDGTQLDVETPRKPPCVTGGKASTKPYSESLVEVTLPLPSKCQESDSRLQPYVATIGAKGFGLSDAPFSAKDGKELQFLAPRAALQGQSSVTLRRLFRGSTYNVTYQLDPLSRFSVTGITILSAIKDKIKYAVTGSHLRANSIMQPPNVRASVSKGGTYLQFELKAAEAAKIKQLVFDPGDDVPLFVALPPLTPPAPEEKPKAVLKPPAAVPVGSSAAYTIAGSNLRLIAAIRYLDAALPFSRSVAADAISVQLPPVVTATPGYKPLTVVFADGTTQQYDVIVSAPK